MRGVDRQTLTEGMSLAYAALSVAAWSHGYLALEKELAYSGKTIQTLNRLDTSSHFDLAASEWEAKRRAVVHLAELGRSLGVIGREINRRCCCSRSERGCRPRHLRPSRSRPPPRGTVRGRGRGVACGSGTTRQDTAAVDACRVVPYHGTDGSDS